VATGADAGAQRFLGVGQQLQVGGAVEEPADLLADDDGRATVLEVGGLVEAVDQLEDRLGAQLVELLESLAALGAAELADVILVVNWGKLGARGWGGRGLESSPPVSPRIRITVGIAFMLRPILRKSYS
jgi:hypothetical protein